MEQFWIGGEKKKKEASVSMFRPTWVHRCCKAIQAHFAQMQVGLKGFKLNTAYFNNK